MMNFLIFLAMGFSVQAANVDNWIVGKWLGFCTHLAEEGNLYPYQRRFFFRKDGTGTTEYTTYKDLRCTKVDKQTSSEFTYTAKTVDKNVTRIDLKVKPNPEEPMQMLDASFKRFGPGLGTRMSMTMMYAVKGGVPRGIDKLKDGRDMGQGTARIFNYTRE